LSKYYPVSLNVENRLCLVVGGGRVAARKARTLLEYDAVVRLVSPEICRELTILQQSGKIEYIKSLYRRDFLAGVFLVIGATGDSPTNKSISDDCRSAGLLVNIADDPGNCNFFVPAVLRRGPLQIAVSTDGKSPLLARKIKEQLAAMYPAGYGDFLIAAGKYREMVLNESAAPEDKATLLESLLDNNVMDMLRDGRFEQAKEYMKNAYNSRRGKLPYSPS